MNLKEIHYVITIWEEQSITNAAKKLFLSQSTLSHSLNKLEEELGTILFDRSTIPLKLTSAGEAVIETGQKLLSLDHELHQRIQDITEFKRGTLTIGLTNLAERYFLPLMLPKFHSRYPGIKILTKVASLASLEVLLLKNKVDFAIMLPLDNPLLECRPIFNMDILLALPFEHPVSKRFSGQQNPYPEIDLAELSNEGFILLQQGTKIRETVISVCKSNGFDPNVIFEVSNFDTAHALVAAGYGITFVLDVTASYAPRSNKVAYFRVKGVDLYQTLCVGHLKNKYLPRIIDSFLEIEKIL